MNEAKITLFEVTGSDNNFTHWFITSYKLPITKSLKKNLKKKKMKVRNMEAPQLHRKNYEQGQNAKNKL